MSGLIAINILISQPSYQTPLNDPGPGFLLLSRSKVNGQNLLKQIVHPGKKTAKGSGGEEIIQ